MFWNKKKEEMSLFEEGVTKLPSIFKDIYSFFIMFYCLYLDFVEKIVISTLNNEIGHNINDEQKDLVYRFLIRSLKNENIKDIQLMNMPMAFEVLLESCYLNRNINNVETNNYIHPDKMIIDSDYKTSFIQLLSKIYAIENKEFSNNEYNRFQETFRQYAIFNSNFIKNALNNFNKISRDEALKTAINHSRKLSRGINITLASSMAMVFMYIERKK
jgi:hypothetical protein